MPALVITHTDCEAVKERLRELRNHGINQIYIFVDGYNNNQNPDNFIQRTNLIEMLKSELRMCNDLEIYFSKSNLGVGIAIPTAVNWFFRKIEYGLVLEDDCSVLPFAQQVLDYIEQNVDCLNDSVVCLSSPILRSKNQSEVDPIELIDSQLFTSWGWICHRKTWQRIALREINLFEVCKAAFRVRNTSRIVNFWLCLSWSDIWLSLRKHQNKLWAFRFTILLILLNVRIYYPNGKGVQHSPGSSGTNVKRLPAWDHPEAGLDYLMSSEDSLQIPTANSLNVYLSKNVQGASFVGLATRFLFKVAKKLGIK
jgi:hypothetical protein